MNDLPTKESQLDDRTLFSLVTDGDCRKLSDTQKVLYYRARCDAAGLDYRAQPFQFISLNGKLVLYALKACTDQLAGKHGIRSEIVDRSTSDGICVVTVRATTKDGRATDEIGAVSVKGLQGDALCNALMKASTKAKRRAVLAVCGLGMLDESELETIPGARADTPQPVVQMPRRLSQRATPAAGVAPPDDSPVSENSGITPEWRSQMGNEVPAAEEEQPYLILTGESDPLDDIEEKLEASRHTISPKDAQNLFATLKAAGHSEPEFRAWLEAQGWKSTKQIPSAKFADVKRRLSDPRPLAEG